MHKSPFSEMDYIAEYIKILPTSCTTTDPGLQYLSVAKNILSASHKFIKDFNFGNHSDPGSQIKLILKCYMTDVFIFIKTYNKNFPATDSVLGPLSMSDGPVIFDIENPLLAKDLVFPLVFLLKFLIFFNDYFSRLSAITQEIIDDFKEKYSQFMNQQINFSDEPTLESYLLQKQDTEKTPAFKNDEDLVLLNNLLKNIFPDYTFLTTNKIEHDGSICSVIKSTLNNMVAWTTTAVEDIVVKINTEKSHNDDFNGFKKQVIQIANLLSNVPQLYKRYSFIFSKLNCTLEDRVAKYFELQIAPTYPITELIKKQKFRNALLSDTSFFEKLGDNGHLIKIILLLGLATELPFADIELNKNLFPDSLAIIPCELIIGSKSMVQTITTYGRFGRLAKLLPGSSSSQTMVSVCSLLEIMENISSDWFTNRDYIPLIPMLQYYVKLLRTSGPIALRVLNTALSNAESDSTSSGTTHTPNTPKVRPTQHFGRPPHGVRF